MILTTTQSLILIATMTAVTMLIRFLPFLLFSRNTPQWILSLSDLLPYAVIAMLVIYCLKDVTLLTGNHGLPEILAVALVVILHKWKHNTLLSILAGTIGYMLLIQLVF